MDRRAQFTDGLAARVYGNGSMGGNGSTGGSGGGNGSNETASNGRYNLAARVYGNALADRTLAPDAQELLSADGTAVAAIAPSSTGSLAPGSTAAPPEVARRARPRRPTRLFTRTFDSLSVVPFRWFLLAMMGQFGAMNMQMLVRGYLVFELTGSFAALGVMSIASAVPMFVFSPVGGVFADRLSRKQVLQVGQVLNGGIAAAMAVLLFLGVLSFEHLLASAALQGFVWALMMPARQAMIPDVVGEERLMNAVALNTAGMNFMRLAAPGLGGLMIAAFGAQWVYVLMASGYLVAVVALIPVPSKLAAAPASGSSRAETSRSISGVTRQSIGDLRDAVRYIVAHKNVLTVLSANFIIVMFSMPYMMLLPGFVADVLHGGPDQLGLLMAITGIGSLAGSLAIASMPSRNRGRILLLSSLLLGVTLIAFSLSRSFALTAALMVLIGLGQTGRMSLSNVLLQAYVHDAYRGRVMSVYMMEFSIVSFGVFAVGVLAAFVGIEWAIGGTAVALAAVSAAGLFYPPLRDLD